MTTCWPATEVTTFLIPKLLAEIISRMASPSEDDSIDGAVFNGGSGHRTGHKSIEVQIRGGTGQLTHLDRIATNVDRAPYPVLYRSTSLAMQTYQLIPPFPVTAVLP